LNCKNEEYRPESAPYTHPGYKHAFPDKGVIGGKTSMRIYLDLSLCTKKEKGYRRGIQFERRIVFEWGKKRGHSEKRTVRLRI
jgi:hypothetical protein